MPWRTLVQQGDKVEEEKGVKVDEIGNYINLISTHYHDVSLYLLSVKIDDKLFLFDSSTSKQIKDVTDITGIPDYCIITHAHPDHAGGSGFLHHHGTVTISSPENKALLFDSRTLLDSFFPDRFKKFFDGEYLSDTVSTILSESRDVYIEKTFSPVKAVEIINAPGHTSASLLVKYNNILFTSDEVQGYGITGSKSTDSIPQIWSINDYLITLNKIKNSRFDILVPGHNFLPLKKAVLEGNMAYRFIDDSIDFVYKLIDISIDILSEPVTLREFAIKLLEDTGHRNGIYPQALITCESIIGFLKNRITIEKEGDIFVFKIDKHSI